MKRILRTLLITLMLVNAFVNPVCANSDSTQNTNTTNTAPDQSKANVTFNDETKKIEISFNDYAAYEQVFNHVVITGDFQNSPWTVYKGSNDVTYANGIYSIIGEPIGENNGTYQVEFFANGYDSFTKSFVIDCYVTPTTEGTADPAITSVNFNETTKAIDVVCSSNDYYKAIAFVYLTVDSSNPSNSWYTSIEDTVNVTKNDTNNSFSISTTRGIGENNGTYNFRIVAKGYKFYNCQYTISCYEGGGGQQGDNFPSDFSAEVNNDGDLLIYSTDQDFLNAMVAQYGSSTNIIIGECGPFYDLGDDLNISTYFFGVHNGAEGERVFAPLRKKGNLVIFSVESQQNKPETDVYRGQVLNDVDYTLIFEVNGYGSKRMQNTFRFTKANTRIPTNHVKAYIADGYLIVSAIDDQGLDFLNNIYFAQVAKLDNRNMISESRMQDDEITSQIFDTISDTYDRVYRIDSDGMGNLNEWTALIDATGYGQYCYDGRLHGGVINVTVEKFKVNLRDINNEISSSEDVIGIYKLPEISPVTNKVVQGWRVKDKNNDTTRCIGEEIFITADTELYAIYKDVETPDKVDMNVIKEEIMVNTIKKIRVSGNAFDAQVQNDSFISNTDKNNGVLIWVETTELSEDTDEYEQIQRALIKEDESVNDDLLSVIDINVFKQVGIDSSAIKISETDTEVEIVLDLSNRQDLRKLAEEGRLGLFSIHEGKVQGLIRGVYDKNTGKYTVKLSKFSTFAFIEAEEDASTVIDSSPSKSKSSRSYTAPKTGIE
ncbi:MAG: hypothetical protein IJI92_00905 [Erysipelotrichaceae bacterium]|nr:hypothetical protein [Erysipelotrichaceae bacterium]